MMYYFTDESNLFALDPWDESIKLCHSHGLVKNFALSKYLPNDIPFVEKFDLIFAFSVFTHLSQVATTTNLNTLSNYLKPRGLIVITVRPVEYWDVDKYAIERGLVNNLKKRHANNGLAFLPHNRPPIDGEITYGDTFMSFQWIEDNFKNLEVAGIDRSLSDRYQIYVFLKIR